MTTDDSNTPPKRGAPITRRAALGTFVKKTLKTAAVVAGSTYIDTNFTGAIISADDAGPAQKPDTSPPEDQLWQHPTSRSSMMIMPLLTFARDEPVLAGCKEKLAEYSNGETPPYFTYETDKEATERYKANGEHPQRAPLINMEFLDPSLGFKNPQPEKTFADKKNRVSLRMIAHHHNPDKSSDFEGFAFYNAKSQTLILAYPGVNPPAVGPAFCQEWDHPNPQIKDVPEFLKDVEQQVKNLNLPVQHTVLFGHSVGADCAVVTLDYLLDHKAMADTFKGVPKTILMEDWQAYRAAQRIVEASGSHRTMDELEKHCTSIRHFPGTFTAVPENPPMGRKVAIMGERHDWNPGQIIARQNDHRIAPTVAKLNSGEHEIHEQFKGDFKAALGMVTANEIMRHPVYATATLAAGGFGIYSARRNNIAREKTKAQQLEEHRNIPPSTERNI